MSQTFELALRGSSQLYVLIPFLLGQKFVIAQVSTEMRIFFPDVSVHWDHEPGFVFVKIPSFQEKLVFPIY